MTQVLESAISKLSQLSAVDQDRIGLWLLEEIADEEKWADRFRESDGSLAKLASEARAAGSAGLVTDIDGKL